MRMFVLRRWQYVDKFRKRAKRGKQIALSDVLASNNLMSLCRGTKHPASLPDAATGVYITKCTELGVVPNSKVMEGLGKVFSRA